MLKHLLGSIAAFIGLILTIVGIFKDGFLAIGLILLIGGVALVAYNAYTVWKNPGKAMKGAFSKLEDALDAFDD